MGISVPVSKHYIASLSLLKATPNTIERPNNLGNPALNQLREADRAVHSWYRFVLSFPPHLVQDYIRKFQLDRGDHILDPFCGTGTTVVEGKKLGLSSVGIEANPMAWFAGSVKLDWTPDPTELLNSAHQVSDAAKTLIEKKTQTLRTLSEESQKIILTHSISPLPLHKTLVLLDQIQRYAKPAHSQHLRLALAKAIVTSISNLRFGPEVSVVSVDKVKEDAPVVDAWLKEVCLMAEDLSQVQTLTEVPAVIHHADARHILGVLAPKSVDGVITSPPYPNEKDYTRTTRLESVLLGFIQNKAELRLLKEGLIRSNTRNVFKADNDDIWVSKHTDIQQIAKAIEERRITLGKNSGFERLYHRAVKLYFGGMAKHLADLRSVLRPGAQLAYVVGDQRSYLQVMIRTGQLLGDIAEGLGYELVDIELFRTRLSTTTQEQMREEVVLLRWSGKVPSKPYPFSDEPL
ncbi:MAG: site-specific DNA-methyltransferase [Acaryochloris sp. RU_4_1]|nr:site-specific DNA-methyltransferase [Acaryochloris sp. SU_5_25]NJM65643.1 site-specific DNA-methyltransferase [Acaryochloris sp. RU_4_1]NJN39009.1 site-specific DNA-methyltransferase [Acaryochloridaceae cyanobacterium CSU_3_4]NJR55916.1 site-specific DNA-methyltransferase [Acaryochloris sp. CRU_2_0]